MLRMEVSGRAIVSEWKAGVSMPKGWSFMLEGLEVPEGLCGVGMAGAKGLWSSTVGGRLGRKQR